MRSDSENDRRGPLVLLVEDEDSISQPFASALARAGFRTQIARTGHDAIELASAQRPDVILLDLALPDQDGRERVPPASPGIRHPDHHGERQRRAD